NQDTTIERGRRLSVRQRGQTARPRPLARLPGGRPVGSRKRTRITVETERVVIINRREALRRWCPACGKLAEMVSPEEAAALAQASSRPVYRWVESEKVHYAEPADGLLRICANSLNRAASTLPIE